MHTWRSCVLAWLVTVQRPKREINYAIASMEQQRLPRELVSIILIEWANVLNVKMLTLCWSSQSCCLFLSKLFLYCFLLSFCIIPCVARNHLKSSISSSILETQVVLARSTRVVPTAIIDPLTWLACLKSEGRHRVYDSKRDHKKKIRVHQVA
ncbi:unnamed protein product [Trifolium pratense]|uniref:Uncharacterized protein n=1 Tax=Trifolium pratense TaxID=57577 RepID=A0ACB0LGJ1_TRIPR|nr:unnamed protein product [Trifolium pratense]